MSKPVIEGKKLSPSEQALFAYLDDMLRAGTESDAAAINDTPLFTEAVTQAATEAATPAATPTPVPIVTESTPRIELQDLTPATVTTADDAAEEALGTAHLPPVVGWQDNGRPDWAQGRFDALIFKVAGLKLAVPLVSLGLIHPIDKKFNALPHQTPWFLGLLRVSGGSIKVIDTAMCVMPERYTPDCREGLKYVITLHGYEWGLACHQVEKAIRLDPDTINWRTQRGKRPWMAGTVRDHMCALIDSTGFHSVIAAVERESDKPRR